MAPLGRRELTPRQREILRLVAAGYPGEEIAERLHMSPWTLRTHTQNILYRMKVNSKTAAVVLALRDGDINWFEIDWKVAS